MTPTGMMSEIEAEIKKNLDSIGIMYRIFSRCKSDTSITEKLRRDKNYGKNKKIQDLIGIRIITYFQDDIVIVHRVISSIYRELEKDNSIDGYDKTEFKPIRYNIVYENPRKINLSKDMVNFIDNTFELQIRTVLSEGWHEVEHDLRYKCKNDWDERDQHSRKLNGVFASLETNEWTILKIFEDLSYSHYKESNWEAMLRHRFRLRISDSTLNERILEIFNNQRDLAKKFYRIDRSELINILIEINFFLPITLSNLIYIYNFIVVKDNHILSITPQLIKDEFLEFQ